MFCLSARLWMDLREFRGREREQKDPVRVQGLQ